MVQLEGRITTTKEIEVDFSPVGEIRPSWIITEKLFLYDTGKHDPREEGLYEESQLDYISLSEESSERKWKEIKDRRVKEGWNMGEEKTWPDHSGIIKSIEFDRIIGNNRGGDTKIEYRQKREDIVLEDNYI